MILDTEVASRMCNENFKACLHQASVSTQSECRNDTCDIALIEINGNK